jgi:hypothetical protein
MKNSSRVFIPIVLAFLLAACAAPATQAQIPQIPSSPTSVLPLGVWEELTLATPYPHKFPLPEPGATPLDGTFAKLDESPPQFWTCYRCADYRPAGGVWRLQFDQGVMRIFYQITNWKSIASFTVEGNRVKIFNDPFCPQDVGEYEWQVADGELTFAVVEDGCAFDLRKENLTKQSWKSCDSLGNAPIGCAESAVLLGDSPADLPVTVIVHAGDSHYFDSPPETYAVANDQNVPSPQGIQLHYHENSIPYGTHRVLWWKGDWLEAITSDSYTSIGVQFWGSGYLGSARVLFDGVEVWRGSTVALGKSLAYYGGYIEVTGFEPGEHVIRVENLGFDYRPVKVVAFGFGNQPVQK